MNIKRGIQRFLLVVTILWFALGSFMVGQTIYKENASKQFPDKYYFAREGKKPFSHLYKNDKFLSLNKDDKVAVRNRFFETVIAPRIEKLGEDSVYTVEQHFIKTYPVHSYEKLDSSPDLTQNFLVLLVPPVVLWVFFYICVWIASGFKKDDSVKNNKAE
jgi:hypothetical protein